MIEITIQQPDVPERKLSFDQETISIGRGVAEAEIRRMTGGE
jgi:hypothetical protein